MIFFKLRQEKGENTNLRGFKQQWPVNETVYHHSQFHFCLVLSSVFPPTEAVTALSAVVIHTQNITRETPGFFVDVFCLKCLQNKRSRCVCACVCVSLSTIIVPTFLPTKWPWSNYFSVSLISISIVLLKKDEEHHRTPPPPLSHPLPPGRCRLFLCPTVRSCLHKTDGVRLMGVFVALC